MVTVSVPFYSDDLIRRLPCNGVPETEHHSYMLDGIQYRILKRFFPPPADERADSSYQGRSKLAAVMGEDIFERIEGKVVIDFGCGGGDQAVEMAQRGARRVIGLDIREDVLELARSKAAAAGVETNCVFAASTDELADVVISSDAFEHFSDPAAILRLMAALLRPAGEVHVSFGPPWYHPLGGHLFSVFPWAHLVFTEGALIRWRSTFKTDGATRFGDVVGGLNQMTIARFERLVLESPLRFASLELAPIRRLKPIHNPFTREFTTSIVRCRLVRRQGQQSVIR